MQADDFPVDTFLGGFFRPLLGSMLVAGLVAGCATSPPSNNQAVEESAQAFTSGASGLQSSSATSEQKTTYALPAAKKHYVPYHWPSPQKDLWSEIRAGFKLKQHKNRRRVRIWTQYYATHTHHLLTALQSARPFLWHVVQQLKKRNMPTEIALLPIVESAYNPKAKSYAGASGLWQFMPGTAEHMHLPRNWWYDGRDDPIASTRAALNYLQLLDQHYDGDWLLALAAYNAGPGRVDDAIASAQADGKPTDFWDLNLPKETCQYVPKLLALRWIMMTPARFGVNWPDLANDPRTRLVKLPSQTSMKVAAHLLGMPESRLRRLNPGMRRWASDPHKHAQLLVPAAKAPEFRSKLVRISPSRLIDRRTHIVHRGDALSRLAHTYHISVAALRQANNLSGNRIYIGQRLKIPRRGPLIEHTRISSRPTRRYVVQAGDTLWNIAHRYRVSVASLRRANSSAANVLHPGDNLKIPGSARPPKPTRVAVHRGDTLWSIAHHHDVSVSDLRRWNSISGSRTLKPGMTLVVDGPAPQPSFYQVEPGDSLWSIASRFSMPVNTLRSLNDLGENSTIQPGERLRIQAPVSG